MTTDHNLVISLFMTFHQAINSIGGVIVPVVVSIVINGGIEPRSSQAKCYYLNGRLTVRIRWYLFPWLVDSRDNKRWYFCPWLIDSRDYKRWYLFVIL
jgi:hypothetical protein